MYTCSLFFYHTSFFTILISNLFFFLLPLYFFRRIAMKCSTICSCILIWHSGSECFFFRFFNILFEFAVRFSTLLRFTANENNWSHTHTKRNEIKARNSFRSFFLSCVFLAFLCSVFFFGFCQSRCKTRISHTKLEMRNIMCKILSRLSNAVRAIFTFIFIIFCVSFVPFLLSAAIFSICISFGFILFSVILRISLRRQLRLKTLDNPPSWAVRFFFLNFFLPLCLLARCIGVEANHSILLYGLVDMLILSSIGHSMS